MAVEKAWKMYLDSRRELHWHLRTALWHALVGVRDCLYSYGFELRSCINFTKHHQQTLADGCLPDLADTWNDGLDAGPYIEVAREWAESTVTKLLNDHPEVLAPSISVLPSCDARRACIACARKVVTLMLLFYVLRLTCICTRAQAHLLHSCTCMGIVVACDFGRGFAILLESARGRASW